MPLDRRTFLRESSLAAGAWSSLESGRPQPEGFAGQPAAAVVPGPAAWPVFDVRRYGARADGVALDTSAFAAAIAAAATAGGGVVYTPPGRYRVGSIGLLSYVTLHLEAGSTPVASSAWMRHSLG
jgi:polygalacturonase